MSLERAIIDVDRFTQAGFAVDLVLTAPAHSGEVANVKGLASKHRLSVSPETGLPINSPQIHVSITERVILQANGSYPVRNINGEIYIKGHLVLYNGINYKVSEQWPDETLGLIVCMLNEYA